MKGHKDEGRYCQSLALWRGTASRFLACPSRAAVSAGELAINCDDDGGVRGDDIEGEGDDESGNRCSRARSLSSLKNDTVSRNSTIR